MKNHWLQLHNNPPTFWLRHKLDITPSKLTFFHGFNNVISLDADDDGAPFCNWWWNWTQGRCGLGWPGLDLEFHILRGGPLSSRRIYHIGDLKIIKIHGYKIHGMKCTQLIVAVQPQTPVRTSFLHFQ